MKQAIYRYMFALPLFLVATYCVSAQGLWSKKAEFSSNGSCFSVCFSILDKGYVGGGTNKAGWTRSLWEYNQGADVWTQKANLGGSSSFSGVGFTIGGKGYVVLNSDSSLWEYDPNTNLWTNKAAFPGGKRYDAVSFSINNMGYVGFGSIGNQAQNGLWEYDPFSDKWTQKGLFPGGKIKGAVAFSILNKGYMGLGLDSANKNRKDFWEYDPVLDMWTRKINFPGLAVNGPGYFSIGAKGYVCSGAGSDSLGNAMSALWEYNVATDKWSRMTDFEGAQRYGGIVFSIGRKGYFGAGVYYKPSTVYHTDFWEYNPDAVLPWRGRANFGGHIRYEAAYFTIGNKGYIGGGSTDTSGSLLDFWEYDPINDVWTQKANVKSSDRHGFSIGDKGYLVSFHYLGDTTWEYSPLNNQWVAKAKFPGGMRDQAIMFSCGGKGYLGMGIFNGSVIKNDFWEYDPVLDKWIQKADFPPGGRFGATGLSINDKGYVGLGLDNSRNYKKDFWEYNPVNNQWTQKVAFKGTARYRSVGFSINGKAYLGLGIDNFGYTKDFWEYNPAIESWKRKEDFGGGPRSDAVGFSIGEKGYVGTGHNFYDNRNAGKGDFWEFEPLNLRVIDIGLDSFCVNDPVKVSYSLGNGDYKIFFQLSDIDGGFLNGIILDSAIGHSGIDSIILQIPQTISSGTYRIRIVGGGDTSNVSKNIKLKNTKTSSIIGMDSVYINTTHDYEVLNTNGSIYNWVVENGDIANDSLPYDNKIKIHWMGYRGLGMVKLVENALNGCSSDTMVKGIVIRNLIDTLAFERDSVVLEASADSIQLSLMCNGDWTILDTNSWLMVSPLSGSDDSIISILVTENPLESQRIGQIVATSDALTTTLIIVQKPNAAVGLSEYNLDKRFMLRPNPVNSFIEISGVNGNAVIVDILGNEVFRIEGDGTYDVTSLKEGVYFIQSGSAFQKMVKY